MRGDDCIFPNVTEKCRLVTGYFEYFANGWFFANSENRRKKYSFLTIRCNCNVSIVRVWGWGWGCEGECAATAEKKIQSLDTTEKVQFVWQMTETTNNLSYFDLQRQLWQEYFNMSSKEDTSQVGSGIGFFSGFIGIEHFWSRHIDLVFERFLTYAIDRAKDSL